MLTQQPLTDITALTTKLSSLSMTLNASSVDTCPNPTEMDRNEQLSFQQQVDLIAEEMNRRATNIGYGAGIGIREQIATPVEQFNVLSSFTNLFKQAYDYSASFIKEMVNWTSTSSTENPLENIPHSSTEDPLKDIPLETIEKHLNSNKCYPEDKATWEAGFPQAVILNANYYRNSLEEYLDKNFIEKSSYHDKFNGNLAKRYHVHTNKISTIPELCQNLEKAAIVGPVKLLILRGHGNPQEFALGPKSNQLNIISEEYHYSPDDKQDLSCLSLLDKETIIILASCNTGGDYYQSFNTFNGTLSFLMNIQRLVALHAPGSTVYAADYYVVKNSLAIQFSPSFEVFALGADAGKFYVDGAITTILSAFSPFFDFPKGFLYKPMKKLSPENAEFCKDVIPYFSMKKYCDKIGIAPQDNQLQDCQKNPSCKEGTYFLNLLDKYYKNHC